MVPNGKELGDCARLEAGTGAKAKPPADGTWILGAGGGIMVLNTLRPCDGPGGTEAGVGPEKMPRPTRPDGKSETVGAPTKGPRLLDKPGAMEAGRRPGGAVRSSADPDRTGTSAKPEKISPSPRELELAGPGPASWLGEPCEMCRARPED